MVLNNDQASTRFPTILQPQISEKLKKTVRRTYVIWCNPQLLVAARPTATSCLGTDQAFQIKSKWPKASTRKHPISKLALARVETSNNRRNYSNITWVNCIAMLRQTIDRIQVNQCSQEILLVKSTWIIMDLRMNWILDRRMVKCRLKGRAHRYSQALESTPK